MDGTVIDITATDEEIDRWFSYTPPDDLIPLLARIIEAWGHAFSDLSRLRLNERLSQDEIVNLLKAITYRSLVPVIHQLVRWGQTSTVCSLLDKIKDHCTFLSLINLKSLNGLNVLSGSVSVNQRALFRYLVKRLGEEPSLSLLTEQDFHQRTGLHWAIRYNHHHILREVLRLGQLQRNKAQLFQLLSLKDSKGLTALSASIHWGMEKWFRALIKYYDTNPVNLLELAAITDQEGNTSFDHAAGQAYSRSLTLLLKSTYSYQTKERLQDVLKMRNSDGNQYRFGEFVRERHSDNQIIYDWAKDCLENDHYLLVDYPSLLIMYSKNQRPGADEEAKSLVQCFKKLGFKVRAKPYFTQERLVRALQKRQRSSASHSGQIVVLMAHGINGYIKDSENKPIALKEVERLMCPETHNGTLKLLILQCCQRAPDPEENKQLLEMSSTSGTCKSGNRIRPSGDYRPTYPDVYTFMSTVAGADSTRNKCIPFLADAITESKIDASVHNLMQVVRRRFVSEFPQQTPTCLELLRFDFCIKKNILPIYLKEKCHSKSKTKTR